jgi:hypothetical protein
MRLVLQQGFKRLFGAGYTVAVPSGTPFSVK